jgi:hypothetical protein
MEADPATLLDDAGDNLDPHRSGRAMFTNEKPGGHGERSVAIGTIDMAVWDARRRSRASRSSACSPSATATAGEPRVFVYAAGGYYYPGKDDERSRPRCAATSTAATRGEDEDRRRPLDEDRGASIGARDAAAASARVDANGRFDLDTAIAYAKALSQYDLFWYEEPGDPLDLRAAGRARALRQADGHRREPLLDAGRAQPHPLRRHAPRPRLAAVRLRAAYGLVEYLRTLEMLRENGWSPRAACRTAATRCRSTSPRGLGSAATILSRPIPALRRLPRRRARAGRGTSRCPTSPASASRGITTSTR